MRKLIFMCLAALLGCAAASSQSKLPPGDKWEEGKYFHLITAVKGGSNTDTLYCLAVDKDKPDSVVVTRKFDLDGRGKSKQGYDRALWKLEKKNYPSGHTYSLRNKATNLLLTFDDGKAGTGLYGETDFKVPTTGHVSFFHDGKEYWLGIGKDKKVSWGNGGNYWSLKKPGSYSLQADELGEGVNMFDVAFDGKHEGDVFGGHKIVAEDHKAFDIIDTPFVRLRHADDSVFADGKAKYIALTDEKWQTTGNGNDKLYGYKLGTDSIRKGSVFTTQFRFAVDLATDSVTLFVRKSLDSMAVVVEAAFESTGYITVSGYKDGKPQTGNVPKMRVSRGKPLDIEDGVYYILAGDPGGWLPGNANVPTTTSPEKQYLVKKDNGRYHIVNRATGEALAYGATIYEDGISWNGEKYEFDYHPEIAGEYMGNLPVGPDEETEKGLYFSLHNWSVDYPVYVGYNDGKLYIDKDWTGDLFHVKKAGEEVTGGAQMLGDTLRTVYWIIYNAKGTVTITDSVAYVNKDEGTPLAIKAIDNDTLLWTISRKDGGLLGVNGEEDNVVLGGDIPWFTVDVTDKPVYDKLGEGYVSFLSPSNQQYLGRSKETGWADMQFNAMPIDSYHWTDFVFEKHDVDTVIPGQPVYKLSIGGWYLAAIDSVKTKDGNTRVGFVLEEDSLTGTDATSWSLLNNENDSTVYLVNLDGGKQIGVENGWVTLMSKGLSFDEQKSDEPTSNEAVGTKETGVHGGEGCVVVDGADGKELRLYGIDGTLVGHWLVTGDRFIVTAPQGVVIATVGGGKGTKLLVR